jgi:hypothetical protein
MAMERARANKNNHKKQHTRHMILSRGSAK